LKNFYGRWINELDRRGGKIIFAYVKQKTRLRHQHKNWERNHRDYNAKIIHLWTTIGNILISEAFYPLLAILEIGLRNSIDYQLTKRFKDREWYDNKDFIKIATRFQIDRISQACFIEQRYRQQFEKPFPFLDFNKELALSHGGNRFVIAIDPSYINKSGKKTPGLGWYWSGCAGQAKWGLEIGGLAKSGSDGDFQCKNISNTILLLF